MRIILISAFILWQFTSFAQLRLNNSNQLSLNHTGNQIGSASFTITNFAEGFAGMYTNSLGINSANPFYGYAVGNVAKAWHNYNGIEDYWALYVGGEQLIVDTENTTIKNNLIVEGGVLFNANEQINENTDLTIKSKQVDDYGGMYIDVNGLGNALPFYGYAVNGIPKAYSYFSENNNSWNLNVNSFYDVMEVKENNVTINGTLKFTSFDGSAEALGTIYYDNGHFYGKTTFGVKQLDNTTNAALIGNDETKETIRILVEENKAMKKQLETIEKYLQSLEEKMIAKKTD